MKSIFPWSRLVPLGRAFFAVALIGLGATHFRFQRFVTGRPPAWPEGVPGGAVIAYLTGLAFVVIGIAILTGRRARAAALVAAALVLAGALLRHIPVLAGSTLLSGDWTRAGKALWLTGGSLMVAATFPGIGPGRGSSFRKLLNRDGGFVAAGRISLGLFQVLGGLQHFKFTAFVVSLIPGWFPGDPIFWAYFAGVALIAGGIGLLIPQTARWAALLSGMMILSWFFIVHLSAELAGAADGIAVFEALAVAGLLLVVAGVKGAKDGKDGEDAEDAKDAGTRGGKAVPAHRLPLTAHRSPPYGQTLSATPIAQSVGRTYSVTRPVARSSW